MLRIAAEMENLRKRTEREVADTRSYAIASFARDMLTATDSLSRALMTLPADARESADPTVKSLIDGMELTEREMQRLLAKHGVKPIEAEGQKFDPHKHQAMFEVPDPTKPEGTVVQVVQQGFAIGDRVLRPAMVGVAKGGGMVAANEGEPQRASTRACRGGSAPSPTAQRTVGGLLEVECRYPLDTGRVHVVPGLGQRTAGIDGAAGVLDHEDLEPRGTAVDSPSS